MTLQIKTTVGTAAKGSIIAVAGSGIRSISDSWICWKPRMEGPGSYPSGGHGDDYQTGSRWERQGPRRSHPPGGLDSKVSGLSVPGRSVARRCRSAAGEPRSEPDD